MWYLDYLRELLTVPALLFYVGTLKEGRVKGTSVILQFQLVGLAIKKTENTTTSTSANLITVTGGTISICIL